MSRVHLGKLLGAFLALSSIASVANAAAVGVGGSVSIHNQNGSVVDFTQPSAVIGTVADGSTDDNTPPVKAGCVYANPAPTYSAGQVGAHHCGIRGADWVQIMSSDGTAGAQVGTTAKGASLTTNRLSVRSVMEVSNGTTLDYITKPNAVYRVTSSAASTNSANIKASAGDLVRVQGCVARTSAVFFKFYDKASPATVGTDTPKFTLQASASACFSYLLDGTYFPTGISIAITTGVADSDTGALAAGDVTALNVTYTN